ncbi:MAG TPA: OmpA family protein, partial [Syntrophales bacterium]
MMKKSWLLAVVGMLALSVSGCMVTESTYLKKVEEAGSLEQGLATCKEEVERLGKQNEELVKKIQSQQEQIGQVEKNREEKVQEVSKTYTQMIEKMKSEIAEGQVTITELQGRLTVNMVDAILFDSGRADIKPEGRQVLQKVAEVIGQAEDKAIRVEGHTDNVKIGGALARAFPSNWELSAARAINVARYLQRLGVDPAL